MESLSYLYSTAAYEQEYQIEYDFPPIWSLRPDLWHKTLIYSTLGVILTFSIAVCDRPAVALMKPGEKSPQVQQLQKQLEKEGFFNGPTTGYYGPITEKAVKRFQQANNLDPDGIVGPKTEQALGTPQRSSVDTREHTTINTQEQTFKPVFQTTADLSTSSSPSSSSSKLLKRGQENREVQMIQKQLKAKGFFRETATGYYGPITEESVKRFQRSNGLKPDGVVGPNTRKALAGELSPNSTMGETVLDLTPLPDAKTQLNQHSDPKETNDPNFNLQPFTDDTFTESNGFNESDFLDSSTEKDSFSEEDSNFNQSSLTNSNASQEIKFQNANSTQKLGFTETNFTDSQELTPQSQSVKSQPMTLQKTIRGNIAPKSIVHSGQGLFFAQNMMYTHSVTVYDRNYNLLSTIPDTINLSEYGYNNYKGTYRGSPVEADFSHNGKYAWVSNYQMYGSGFDNPGDDKCQPTKEGYDKSFVFRINTDNLTIDRAIKVGSVPKYVAASSDDRLVLVSNWCSYDVSVIDTNADREVKRIKLGRYPRGIVIDNRSQVAYVAVMGSSNIAKIDLNDFSVSWMKNVGKAPRHLNISPDNQYLYVSLNGEDKIAKIDLQTEEVITKIKTGDAPRSMALSGDGRYLYVVNYFSNTMSKVATETMKVLETVDVATHPIGITYDDLTNEVWVSCYSGKIMVFSG